MLCLNDPFYFLLASIAQVINKFFTSSKGVDRPNIKAGFLRPQLIVSKKSRSEKEALMEQLAILSNTLPTETKVNIYFATAYNRFGEGKPWKQERVRQYFADKELLIGKDFWNFICKSEDGYETVLDAYKEKSSLIKDSLDSIKKTYLG